MMNVYAIYISMKSGDVEITRTFSRYSRAIASLQEVIEKYITDRGLTNNSRIVAKADFAASNVSKDKTFPNGYCFRKGKNSVIIYKKTTDVGYIKNAVTFEEVGKIGVCDFDVRLPSGVNNRNNRNNRNSRSGLRSRYKNRRSLGNDEVEENPSDDDCEVGTISKVTNQEHGRYITMIEELKSVLDNRRNRMNLKSFDEDNEGKEDEDTEGKEDGTGNRNDKGKEEEEIVDPFLLHLEQVRTNLNNVPVPVVKIGYALGKVIDNNDNDRYDEYSKEYDYSNDRYDEDNNKENNDNNKENNDNNKMYRSHSALNIRDCLGSNDNIRYSL